MSITLYHLTNSRSQRVVWLLTALNLEYNLVFCERNEQGLAPDFLKTIHPLGKVPILTIQNNNQTITLAETSAIFDYLSVKYSNHQLFNTQVLNDNQLANYCYFKNFADSSLMPNLALKQIFSRMVDKSPLIGKPITGKIKQVFDSEFLNPSILDQLTMINNLLKNQKFLVDDSFKTVDILMEFMLSALAVSQPNFAKFENICRYLDDLHELPSYQQAVEKGKFDKQEFIHYWQTAW